MNRIIKFRAWDDEIDVMTYSSDMTDVDHYWIFEDGKIKAFGLKDIPPTNYDPPDKDPYELENIMQFTGLTDKNGKEIYEGDIVTCVPRGCPHQIIWAKEIGGTYWGGMPGWYLSGLNDGYAWTGEEELIGNIYENPDLL